MTNKNINENIEIVSLTPDNIAEYGVCGYKDVKKNTELQKKIEWFKEYYPKGLRIKIVVAKTGGYQGMIEYISGQYAHRPVDAENYLFIHCLFVGFRKEHKGKGYASALIEECVKDAKNNNMSGVAVVTRQGSFMAKKDIFIKKGFEVVDKAKPDFELLVLKFKKESINPKFILDTLDLKQYSKGLTIIRSPQCPYTEKNVNAIIDSAKNMKLDINLIELRDHLSAQHVPCAFGTFCIIYKGEIISHHPISNTRFENIMKTINK